MCEGRGISVQIVPDLFPIQTDTQIYDFDEFRWSTRLYPTGFIGYIVIKRTFDRRFLRTDASLRSFPRNVLIEADIPGTVFFTRTGWE